jgi:hypothetical protein
MLGDVLDAVLTVAALAVCAVLAWVALRMEPHWVSKDGRRFTCRIQLLGRHDVPEGGWREMRAVVDGDGLWITARGPLHRSLQGRYRVLGRSRHPPKGKVLWLLVGDTQRLVLRVPERSRAVAVLDGLTPQR